MENEDDFREDNDADSEVFREWLAMKLNEYKESLDYLADH